MSRIHSEDDKTIKDLLESNSLIFRIPINQRKFSWGNEQLEMFFEDLKGIIGGDNRHYLGVLSLIVKECDDINFNCYEIIDGQQRTTTIILFVAALRDIYYALRDEIKAKKIQENYLSALSIRKCFNKLQVSRLDSFTFNKIVNINVGDGTDILLDDCPSIACKRNKCRTIDYSSNDYVNIKMYNAYRYFFNEILLEIERFDTIDDKKNYLLDLEESLAKLDVILIKSDDIESIFLFFESLNNRGLQLSKMDIIRNVLLKIVSERFSESLSEFGDLWDKLVTTLDGHDEIKFLKYYFMCTKENKIIKEKDLPSYYDTYLKKYTMKNDLRLEIDRMRKYSILYTKLFTKEVISTSDEIYVRNIKMINQLGQQACHSFLMDYMYYVSDESRLDYITSLIEKMMLRRIVCSRSTKQLDGIFRDIIKTKFKNGYEYNDTEIYNIIIDNIPSDVEFANTLKEKVWDANEITNYILRKFEYELSGKSLSKEFVIRSRKDVHIEHIIPVNFDSEWPKELNLQGEKSQYDILTSKLGNLILLEFDINTSIKDSLFNVKLAKYRESTLKQVQIFINEFDKWNEEKINERTENLVELAVNIWRV